MSTPVRGFEVRAMESGDLAAAAEVAGTAFGQDTSNASAAQRREQRLGYLLATDAGGCFVAERDGYVVGVAQAFLRERLWCLSMLAVRPGVQSAGAGRALLERALSYGADADAKLIVSSNDPRALRLYALSGFSLRAAFQTEGPLDRRALPKPHAEVRDADQNDLDALAAISRDIRGAPHTAEIELALGQGARLFRFGDRGFTVAHPVYGVWLLVARDDVAATALLWSALEFAGGAEPSNLRWITSDQEWAIDVIVRAGLQFKAYGALCVAGRPGPLRPFVPSGPFA